MQLTEQQLFPAMSGTEEEIRVSFYHGTSPSIENQLLIPENQQFNMLLRHFTAHSPTLLPAGTSSIDTDHHVNGSRIYFDNYGLELTTPECDTPQTQATYIEANARLLTRAVEDFATHLSRKRGHAVMAVQQRRVVDSYGNSWGCHDNFSLSHRLNSAGTKIGPYAGGELIKAHVLSRNFITGAGRFVEDGMSYSQKLTMEHGVEGYGYNPYLFRIDDDHGQRLEIRCNDINLSPWAMVARIGGSALMVAAAQSSLARQLVDHPLADFMLNDTKSNHAALINDFRLVKTPAVSRAVDFQIMATERILDSFQGHTGEVIPETYQQIGKVILEYCEDMRLVLSGRADLELLADRADWAAKLVMIRSSSRRRGRPFTPRSQEARLIDPQYDRIVTIADTKGRPTTRHGFGYGLADRQQPDRGSAIATAYKHPPANTRAARRVETVKQLLAQQEQIVALSWDSIGVKQGNKVKTIRL